MGEDNHANGNNGENENSGLTTMEKRKKRVEDLRARLAAETAKLKKDSRKERTGQLIAFGIFFERYYKKLGPQDRMNVYMDSGKFLDARNSERFNAGIKRLDAEKPADNDAEDAEAGE